MDATSRRAGDRDGCRRSRLGADLSEAPELGRRCAEGRSALRRGGSLSTLSRCRLNLTESMMRLLSIFAALWSTFPSRGTGLRDGLTLREGGTAGDGACLGAAALFSSASSAASLIGARSGPTLSGSSSISTDTFRAASRLYACNTSTHIQSVMIHMYNHVMIVPHLLLRCNAHTRARTVRHVDVGRTTRS